MARRIPGRYSRRNKIHRTVTSPIDGVHDDSDLFVTKRVLCYLHRMLRHYCTLDDELMDILTWALKEDMASVGDFLYSRLSNRDQARFRAESDDVDDPFRISVADEANDAERRDEAGAGDHDDETLNYLGYDDAIQELVEWMTPKDLAPFRDFLVKRLMARHDALPDAIAPCELERNLDALQKLFNLSDAERELCTFLFIIDKYDEAQRYFSFHLECNKYPARKYVRAIIDLKGGSFYDLLNGRLKQAAILDPEDRDMELNADWIAWLEHPSDQVFTRKFYKSLPKNSISLDLHFIPKTKLTHLLTLLAHPKERLSNGVDPQDSLVNDPDLQGPFSESLLCGTAQRQGHSSENASLSNTRSKRSFFGGSCSVEQSSTHILLYGPPGSGKTSFARGVAARLDMPAHEIMQGDENKSSSRQAAIRACINMNAGEAALIVVDEADNLLNTGMGWFQMGETRDKGWLNQLMEEPGLRIIWITNRIDEIEPSVMRRFAYSIPFRPFNRRQRYQLWKNTLHRYHAPLLADADAVGRLAHRYQVSAGGIDLAVRKAVEARIQTDADFLEALHLTLSAHETLMNAGDPPDDRGRIDTTYSLKGLSMDGDVDHLMGQLDRFDRYLKTGNKGGIRHFNILFYGPPGTGKSELGRYIARRLDRSVVCREISEIQSKYVGESEQNIRAAFDEAEDQDAVLIFDEVDSLLFDREQAVRSWEVSFTNAFITRMERFRGILVCTTNRIDGLDGASFRRFNHKIGLKYLTAEGNVIFYNRMIAPLMLSETVVAKDQSMHGDTLSEHGNPKTIHSLDEKNEALLRRQKFLTPGDFKVVRDNFSFYPEDEVSHDACVAALLNEVKQKKKYVQKGEIGF